MVKIAKEACVLLLGSFGAASAFAPGHLALQPSAGFASLGPQLRPNRPPLTLAAKLPSDSKPSRAAWTRTGDLVPRNLQSQGPGEHAAKQTSQLKVAAIDISDTIAEGRLVEAWTHVGGRITRDKLSTLEKTADLIRRWKNGEQLAPREQKLELAGLIFLWYAGHVACAFTSKALNMHWAMLTFAQFVISSVCGLIATRGFKIAPQQPLIPRGEQLKLTALLSAFYILGFSCLNTAFGMMQVSLVMTFRATAPFFMLILAGMFLKTEKITMPRVLSLMPVVAGVALSSACSIDFSLAGLAVMSACNVFFSFSAITSKKILNKFNIDTYNLFFQISVLGAIMQGIFLMATLPFGAVAGLPVSQLCDVNFLSQVLLNGVAFYAYIQLAWVVLSRVSAVTYAVCNSMRQPVMCLMGMIQFGAYISPLNALGVAMASLGTLLYSQVQKLKLPVSKGLIKPKEVTVVPPGTMGPHRQGTIVGTLSLIHC